MKYIFLLLLLFSVSSWAQVKHVVFDLDGTLVQQVPQNKLGTYTQKDLIFTVSDGPRNANYHAYQDLGGVLEVLDSEPGLVIHFFSKRSASWVKAVLSSIKTPKRKVSLFEMFSTNGISQILTADALTDGRIDLKKITTDFDNIIFVTSTPDQLLASQKRNEFLLSAPYYFFESFALLDAEMEKLRVTGYYEDPNSPYPPNEAVWNLSNRRVSYFNEVLREALKGKDSLVTEIQKKVDEPEMLRRAQLYSQAGYKDSYYSWIESKSKVKGCQKQDIRNSTSTTTVDLKLCMDLLPVNFYWNSELRDQCYSWTANLSSIRPEKNENCSKLGFIEKRDGENKVVNSGLVSSVSNLFIFNRASKGKGSVFPRTSSTLYRCMTEAQFDLRKGIRAIFYDPYAVVESKTFSSLKMSLQDKKSPVSFDYQYMNYDQRILAAKKEKKFDELEAMDETVSLMDRAINEMPANWIQDSYLTYGSPTYQDWSPDLVFGTIFYSVASLYWQNIIVFYKDTQKRGVDLNWFNQVGSAIAADTGEYVLPLMITAEDVYGVQDRKSLETFVRVVHNQKPYMLVFKAQSCLLKLDDEIVYQCGDYVAGAMENPIPAGSVANPIAIYGLCPKHERCEAPQSLLAKYRFTRGSVSYAGKGIINNLEVNGQEIQDLTK